MKRWAQLTELRHSLSRARVFAEQTGYPALAGFITNALTGINSEIEKLELAKQQPPAKETVKRRTTKSAPATNPPEEEQ